MGNCYKISIWKLKLKGTLNTLKNYLTEKGIIILEFDFDNLETLLILPFHHQNPFDRIIIAQVKTKSLEIITDDPQVRKYFD